MSVDRIREIIRHHTGRYANDAKKISHAEVEQMLQSVEDQARITAGERLELLAALRMFGGSAIHPDIFESGADKALVAAAILRGIESSARFQALPPGERATFLAEVTMGAEPIGFRSVRQERNELPPPVRERLETLLKENRVKAGADYEDCSTPGILAAVRDGQVYGYRINCLFRRRDGQLAYATSDLIGAGGELLRSHGTYEPPEHR